MASEIVDYMESELLDVFNEGREDEARAQGLEYGVWSSILDEASCDFCRWADEKTFLVSEDHPIPPVHFGCRCVIAYYNLEMIEEDELEPEQMFIPWEDPPASLFPIGRKRRGN